MLSRRARGNKWPAMCSRGDSLRRLCRQPAQRGPSGVAMAATGTDQEPDTVHSDYAEHNQQPDYPGAQCRARRTR
ncbi:hypothetical protein GCM10020369_44060 [Cryptosporangium minutisporangium]|uniref:Uncharacterized protein n=1 Tax=Cryptosporangium minutisporangium TaxID=113569 RepID=A0ABP6T2K7_9ACTN